MNHMNVMNADSVDANICSRSVQLIILANKINIYSSLVNLSVNLFFVKHQTNSHVHLIIATSNTSLQAMKE
jgi:hypothetical protein